MVSGFDDMVNCGYSKVEAAVLGIFLAATAGQGNWASKTGLGSILRYLGT